MIPVFAHMCKFKKHIYIILIQFLLTIASLKKEAETALAVFYQTLSLNAGKMIQSAEIETDASM